MNISKLFSLWILQGLVVLAVLTTPLRVPASPSIVPTVQQMELTGGQELVVDESWAIVTDESDPDELFNAHYLKESLIKEFGVSIDIYDAGSRRAKTEKRFVLGKPGISRRINRLAQQKGVEISGLSGAEGYILDTSMHNNTPDVFVLGNESAGVFYGIQSLLKHPNGSFQSLFLQDDLVKVEQFVIHDQPDKAIRGAFAPLASDNNFTDVYEWIDVMARLKMNMIVMGDDASQLIDLDQIYAYARRHYMEPVPFLRGVQGRIFVSEDPHISEGIPVVGELFGFTNVNGIQLAIPEIPVDQTNRVANADFEEQVSGASSAWYFSGLNHWSWDTTISHSGTASVKIHVTPEDGALERVSGRMNLNVSHLINVEGGHTYMLSFWAKTENVGGDALPIIRTTQKDAFLAQTLGADLRRTTIRLPAGSKEWRQYFQPIYLAKDTRFLDVMSLIGKGGYGTVWLDDFELRRMDGSLVNVIRTESSDIRVTSQDGLTVFEEGRDYRVIDGDFSFNSMVDGVIHQYYPLNKPTRIELLPGGAIDPSSKVRVAYDFCVDTDTSNSRTHYSINDQRTYSQHVLPYLDEMIGTLQPAYALYSGASELRGINRDSRNGDMQNYELVAEDINNVYDHLKSIDPGLKIFLWDDMMSPWHTGDKEYHQSGSGGGAFGATEPKDYSLPRVTDLIPRSDLIPWAWWYNTEDPEGRIANTPDYLEGKSFQWVASPEDIMENILDWVDAIRGRPNAIGMIDWANDTYDGIVPVADYSWNNDNTTN